MDDKALYKYLGLMAVYSVVEYWLGKTKKTRANSTIELLSFVVVGLVTLAIHRIKNARDKQ